MAKPARKAMPRGPKARMTVDAQSLSNQAKQQGAICALSLQQDDLTSTP